MNTETENKYFNEYFEKCFTDITIRGSCALLEEIETFSDHSPTPKPQARTVQARLGTMERVTF